ncbi:MAG: N-acetylmuramoyl-L-alanine amidase [Chlamydiales bacterium]|nr:N-acetylmuramoyl-L-alanine amidase [Chlamydiales bacterium]
MQPLVVLDAGHGGKDNGASFGNFLEKRVNIVTALLTKKHLENLGYRVIMTRSKDIFVPLDRRVEIATRVKADVFVSIHFNSSTNRLAEGIEVYYYSSNSLPRNRASMQLAKYVLPRLIDQTGANSRGVKVGNFHVIRETAMPAVLVEGGFITNVQERQKIRQRTYLDQIALGIAQGVDKYFKMNKCPRRELNARPAA